MPSKISWSSAAVRDLETIADSLLQEDPDAAQRVVDSVFRSAEQLERFPGSGRPGRVEGTRELLVPHFPYLLVYEEAHVRIFILRVLHARRSWPS